MAENRPCRVIAEAPGATVANPGGSGCVGLEVLGPFVNSVNMAGVAAEYYPQQPGKAVRPAGGAVGRLSADGGAVPV